MKKLFAAILACAMALTSVGSISAFAGSTDAPQEMVIPDDASIFVKTDFETSAADVTIKKTAIFSSATAYTATYKDGSNMVMRYYADDGQSHGPRVAYNLPYSVKTFCVDYAIKPQNSMGKLELYSDGAINTDRIATVAKTVDGVEADKWNYVHVKFDLEGSKASGTINGKPFTEISLKPIADLSTVSVRISSKLEANDAMYYDNVAIYTTDKVEFDGPLRTNNQVDWSYVHPKRELGADSYVNNLTEHPRILVRGAQGWDTIREKINTSYEAKKMYERISELANSALESEPPEYAQGATGNALGPARTGKRRIMALAFAYNIERDKRYLDDAYDEMVKMGQWQDWSASNAFLATGEIMFGYACAVDWLYDALTSEQRDTIYKIVEKHALTGLVFQYEKPNECTFNNPYNWNPVCNSGAIGIALAFADEHKEVCEYILENGMEMLVQVPTSYEADGGYGEGAMYWNLSIIHLAFAMDMIENTFKEGYKIPEKYILSNSPGLDKTADFMIYFNGTTGCFNYGDATVGIRNNGALYWLAARYNKPQYALYANNLQNSTSYMTDYQAILSLISYDPAMAKAQGNLPLDAFFKSDADDGFSGISLRSSWAGNDALYAAMQGGYNGLTHGYLSLGTYVIDFHNKRFVKQLGEYDYNLQGAKKDIYYKRAEGSNCLVINPSAAEDQNPKSNAKLTASGSGDNTAYGILDMTRTSDDYISAKRGMMITDNRRRVIIQDEAEAKAPSEFYWFANTEAGITIAKDGKSAVLNMDGEKMLVRIIKGPDDAKFTIMERSSLIEGVQNTVTPGTKLAIHMTDVTKLELAVEYVGLEDGEGIPDASEYVPMNKWTCADNGKTVVSCAGDATVLKLDTPNAIAQGQKTFVDPDNFNVYPIEQNGRTLVPVRFISESFNAKVGWNEQTQTVTVNYKDKDISLNIGESQITVNGEARPLDVPAQTINDRTLIPLRALAEALGKKVFWDDRGLIIISDNDVSYDADTINKMITELNIQVKVNGNNAAFFSTDRKSYNLDVKNGEAIPQIDVSTIGDEVINVVQAGAIGESAVLNITANGETYTYTFTVKPDEFEGLKSSRDDGVINGIKISSTALEKPAQDNFIYVEDLKDSTGWVTYPKRGSVDGVINEKVENRWACNGEGWLEFDLGKVYNINSMAFAGVTQNQRAYNFDVLVSEDEVNWTEAHTGGAPTTTEKMSIIPLGDVKARYIKMVGKGNNQNTWNTWAEVRFYETEEKQKADKYYWPAYFPDDGIHGVAGETKPLLIKGIDGSGNTFDLSDSADIKYEFLNPTIASVDDSGQIVFMHEGSTTLTITVSQDGFVKRAKFQIICDK